MNVLFLPIVQRQPFSFLRLFLFQVQCVDLLVVLLPFFLLVSPYPFHDLLDTKQAQQDVYRAHDEHEPRGHDDEDAVEEPTGGGGVLDLVQGPHDEGLVETDGGEEQIENSAWDPVDH